MKTILLSLSLGLAAPLFAQDKPATGAPEAASANEPAQVAISGKSEGTIARDALLASELTIVDPELKAKAKITGFTFTAELGGDVVEATSTEGGKFSERQREIMGKLKAGEKFYFESITVTLSDGTERKLSTIKLTLE